MKSLDVNNREEISSANQIKNTMVECPHSLSENVRLGKCKVSLNLHRKQMGNLKMATIEICPIGIVSHFMYTGCAKS